MTEVLCPFAIKGMAEAAISQSKFRIMRLEVHAIIISSPQLLF
jgi:hypothetical protein